MTFNAGLSGTVLSISDNFASVTPFLAKFISVSSSGYSPADPPSMYKLN